MRVLALDYGEARCGVAVSDATGTLATPVGVVEQPGTRRGLASLVARTDFAATYLALGGGIDPSRSPHLADLREVWASGGEGAAPG